MSNISDNARLVRVMGAVESVHIVGRAATPGIAAEIVTMTDPTVGRIAGLLYLRGSKGGKAAALYAAEIIAKALHAATCTYPESGTCTCGANLPFIG